MNQKDYYSSLPKKHMGSGVLLFDNEGRLLILKPTYKPHWTMPGGVVDVNESPRQACKREIKEEIGLYIKNLRFICVDYKSPEGKKPESLQFYFYGGKLSSSKIKEIRLQANELESFKFETINSAKRLLSPAMARRLPKCMIAIKTGKAVCLENGNFPKP